MERRDKLRVVAVYAGGEIVEREQRGVYRVFACMPGRPMRLVDELDYDTDIAELWPVTKKLMDDMGTKWPVYWKLREVKDAHMNVGRALVYMDIGKLFDAVVGAILVLNEVENGGKAA